MNMKESLKLEIDLISEDVVNVIDFFIDERSDFIDLASDILGRSKWLK